MNHFSERLKSARTMQGLSLQDLADKMQGMLSKQILSKYELGEVNPSEASILAISKALGLRPDYFSRTRKVELSGLEFRKLSRYPAREKGKAIGQAQEMLERYFELEDILGIDSHFVNPISGIKSIQDEQDVEAAAEELRQAWGLGLKGPLGSVVEMLEDHEIKVVGIDVEEGLDGSQGIVNHNKNLPVIVLNKMHEMPKDRIRFSGLHELGHLVLPISEKIPLETKEKWCHYFAGAMLMPRQAAIMEFGPKRNKILFKELGAVKQQYGISMQALMIRLLSLGIVSKSYVSSFFFMMNQLGYRKIEPFPFDGKEKSDRFLQLLFRALAEEIIPTDKAAALNNQTVEEFRKEHLALG